MTQTVTKRRISTSMPLGVTVADVLWRNCRDGMDADDVMGGPLDATPWLPGGSVKLYGEDTKNPFVSYSIVSRGQAC